MNLKYLNLAIDGSGIGIITLNRPEVCNAFDEQMIHELTNVIESLNRLSEIRVILLTAEGKHFSAGADLAWMQRVATFTHEQNLADATALAKLMETLYTSPKVTIALVQGATYGGGIGLLACCDIVLADPEAQFCFSEVKIGLIPAVISPYVIRAIGAHQTKRYFLTAEIFNSEKALSLGLIHEIVDASKCFEQGYQLALQILQNGPEALKATKTLVQSVVENRINADTIQKTVEAIATIRTSEEAQRRLNAFLEKRSSHE